MEFTLLRLTHEAGRTRGVLYGPEMNMLAYTLEDQVRSPGEKIYGRTAIGPGNYALALRTYGGWDRRLGQRFRRIHRGAIEVLDVPNFTNILIHPGNDAEDTRGCILLGASQTGLTVRGSSGAYRAVYPVIANAIESGPTSLIVTSVTGLPPPEAL